jgi:FixJ family two-component response regulator
MKAQPQKLAKERKLDGLIDIAVLDDDLDFVHYLEDFLKEEELYRVRTFTHPVDLLASCDQRKPDIVLLDMKMGPFKGEEVIQQLQERYRDLCIIVLTGYPSLEDMRATFKRKVFDYLAKPFSLSQLRQTLKNAVETHDLGRSPHARLRDRLGHRLKLLRVERNWSLKDLAGMTGVSVSQLSSIERGTHLPSMESMLALCQALDVKPSDLLMSIDF